MAELDQDNPNGAIAGPDGRPRCPWGLSAPDYVDYHDQEWGRPLRGVTEMFERLCLEGFQSGLSWLVILRKREAFRRAFAGFDPAVVAEFGDDDTARLLNDPGIVRNRAKIEAARRNARAVLALDEPLDELLWSFAPDPAGRTRPRTLADVPAVTPESTAMAKALKKRGFSFVGPTTCYALMQATGLVNDHLEGCSVNHLVNNTN
ncbi:DNA-3-methyladenine glycosylase I [Pseudonocardia spinosispora]|uniref:DNA-3-methyladenine glycosylase I n=1 Tax=Pseudonocardia spinosispora TaxID=103441 RepID=UPI0003FC548A|nr:DNA-3-methyladenine glycosylase I [Pseudonocardia spinosispora]